MKAKRILSFVAVIVILFAFLANFADLHGYEVYTGVGEHGQMSLCAENSTFSEVVYNQESLGTKAQNLFSDRSLKYVSKHVISLKNLRMILIACRPTCLFAFVQFRIFWVLEKATTRSQKTILQFIHKKDGQKI